MPTLSLIDQMLVLDTKLAPVIEVQAKLLLQAGVLPKVVRLTPKLWRMRYSYRKRWPKLIVSASPLKTSHG